jgi:type II secretory ATPase GspE/PulE/Tfp pilus assembly ATPase PilB-like protein
VNPIGWTVPGLKFNQVDSKTIRETAVSDGMVTMLQDGTEKAQAGLTTMEEVLRVIPEDG